MKDFQKWLNAKSIEINMNCIVIDFDDEEMYDAITEMYECEGLLDVINELKIRISPKEFQTLIQVYMDSITYWN